jgi:hypothetical protein
MNAFSWVMLSTMSVTAVLGYVLLLVQSARQHKQMQALEAQLDIFVDSSISVARSVDRLLQQGGSAEMVNVSSRRWVLQEAKSRLNKGESVFDIAVPLGLSKDEVRLLNVQLH